MIKIPAVYVICSSDRLIFVVCVCARVCMCTDFTCVNLKPFVIALFLLLWWNSLIASSLGGKEFISAHKSVFCCEEVPAAGAQDIWSHHSHSQEQACAYCSFLLCTVQGSAHEMLLPFILGLLTLLDPVKKQPEECLRNSSFWGMSAGQAKLI